MYRAAPLWGDPALGRWTQPDTVAPVGVQGVQAWDRYAYVNNSPARFNDPSGRTHSLAAGINPLLKLHKSVRNRLIFVHRPLQSENQFFLVPMVLHRNAF
jgi:hypothetical protein